MSGYLFVQPCPFCGDMLVLTEICDCLEENE